LVAAPLVELDVKMGWLMITAALCHVILSTTGKCMLSYHIVNIILYCIIISSHIVCLRRD